jgi:hypothetical protein
MSNHKPDEHVCDGGWTCHFHDVKAVERQLRERALEIAGHHIPCGSAGSDECVKRAETYLAFLKGGDNSGPRD